MEASTDQDSRESTHSALQKSLQGKGSVVLTIVLCFQSLSTSSQSLSFILWVALVLRVFIVIWPPFFTQAV